MTDSATITLPDWAARLRSEIDAIGDEQARLDFIPNKLGWPSFSKFPRPGAAAGWGHPEWQDFAKSLGYERERETAHQFLYRHPCGARFGTAKTTGDARSTVNCLSDARLNVRDLQRVWLFSVQLILRNGGTLTSGTEAEFWSGLPDVLSKVDAKSIDEDALRKELNDDVPKADMDALVGKIVKESGVGVRAALINYLGMEASSADRISGLTGMASEMVPRTLITMLTELLIAVRSSDAIEKAFKEKRRAEQEAARAAEEAAAEAEAARKAAEYDKPWNRHQRAVAAALGTGTGLVERISRDLLILEQHLKTVDIQWEGRELFEEHDALLTANSELAEEIEKLQSDHAAASSALHASTLAHEATKAQLAEAVAREKVLERDLATANELVSQAGHAVQIQQKYAALVEAVKSINPDSSIGQLMRAITKAQEMIA